jgi:hypothetical protein
MTDGSALMLFQDFGLGYWLLEGGA